MFNIDSDIGLSVGYNIAFCEIYCLAKLGRYYWRDKYGFLRERIILKHST